MQKEQHAGLNANILHQNRMCPNYYLATIMQRGCAARK